MASRTTVGVVGASARAAVHSLIRAGFNAWAVDLFGDRDLRAVAPCAVCPMADYPAALPRLTEQFPPGPVMYTGGLENHPQIVAELARKRELWGTSPEVLETVRDPFRLLPILAAAGFVVPKLVPHGEPCPATGRWLRKPIRSAGGLGVRFATLGEPASPSHIFQEFIEGQPMSVVFGGTTYLGVSEQLVGERWLRAKQFVYCGNITSLDVAGAMESELARIGSALFSQRSLRGIWNIDFVQHGTRFLPVEVNPRYTASVEVLEQAYGSAVSAAVRRTLSVSERVTPTPSLTLRVRQENPKAVGKAIYFAPHDFTFPASGPWDADLATPFDPWRLAGFADIPAAGSPILAGHPVITMFASGSSATECRENLQSQARELDQLFAETTR